MFHKGVSEVFGKGVLERVFWKGVLEGCFTILFYSASEGRYWSKGQTPHWAKCTGHLAPRTSTWKRNK